MFFWGLTHKERFEIGTGFEGNILGATSELEAIISQRRSAHLQMGAKDNQGSCGGVGVPGKHIC